MIASKEQHIHKFDKLVTQKIMVSAGLKIAHDTLKQYKCACGKRLTYDLVREIK